jgi:hypothetical protein
MSRGRQARACGWLAAALLAGCGNDVERGTVAGVLQRQGRPLGQVLVTFLPEAAAPGAVRAAGVTDDQGRFRLKAEDQSDGVAAGPYRVLLEDMAVYALPRAEDGSLLATPPPRFAAHYADPLRTPLRQTVALGNQTITLDIDQPITGGRTP